MGMPGVGKGTHAIVLRDHLGVPHVSTGDILREAVRAGTALGRRVRGILESGQLVSDDLMRELITERLGQDDAREGFILDGFPRTQEQVKILDGVLEQLSISLDAAYVLAAPEDEIVHRLGGRRVCPKCSEVYHLETKPPASAGVCDACGSALVQRADDTETIIRDRLRVYADRTLPVAAAYRDRGLLREIDASGSPATGAERLRQTVGKP